MKNLLLCLLLSATPAWAADSDVQFFSARAEGSLTVGADGRVLDVELTSQQKLGDEVIAGYEERIRRWRFEPITENGQPVNAKGRMQLSLVAMRDKANDTATFAIRHVQFLDPPGTAPGAGWPQLAQPFYPTNALRAGVGAQLMLLLKLDDQGRVVSAATEHMELLGVATGQSHQGNLAAQFRRSAEQVAAKWTIPGQPEGGLVRVPVSYFIPALTRGWTPMAVQSVELPEWAVLDLAAESITDLSASGTATAAQFKLLTPLDGT